MKIVFNRQEVINCVTPIMCAASSVRSSIAAVEGILFEAEAPSTVVMTTYDLEKGVRTTVEADVLEGGSCVKMCIRDRDKAEVVKLVVSGKHSSLP